MRKRELLIGGFFFLLGIGAFASLFWEDQAAKWSQLILGIGTIVGGLLQMFFLERRK